MWRILVSKKICLQLFLSQTGKRRIVSFLLNRYPSGSHSLSPWQDEPWFPPALPTALSARQALSLCGCIPGSYSPALTYPSVFSFSTLLLFPPWITLVTSMAPALQLPLGILKHLSYLHFDFFISASWMVRIPSVWPRTCLSHHYFPFRIHGFALIYSIQQGAFPAVFYLSFQLPPYNSNYHHPVYISWSSWSTPVYLLISLQTIIKSWLHPELPQLSSSFCVCPSSSILATPLALGKCHLPVLLIGDEVHVLEEAVCWSWGIFWGTEIIKS